MKTSTRIMLYIVGGICGVMLCVAPIAMAQPVTPGGGGGAVTGTTGTFSGDVTTSGFFRTGPTGGFLQGSPNASTGIRLNSGDVTVVSAGTTIMTCAGGSGICTDNFGFATSAKFTSTAASGSHALEMATGAQLYGGASGATLAFDGSGNGQFGSNVYAIGSNASVNTQMGTSGNYSSMSGIANVTTADVSSSGISNLISYTLPASSLTTTNRCLRITGWGTALNNANAKTVALVFGSQTLITKQIAPSIATETWKVTATVCRSGSNTQDIYAEAWNEGGTTLSSTDGATVLYQSARVAGTQTETSAIVIKGTTTVATTADITMDALVAEFF